MDTKRRLQHAHTHMHTYTHTYSRTHSHTLTLSLSVRGDIEGGDDSVGLLRPYGSVVEVGGVAVCGGGRGHHTT